MENLKPIGHYAFESLPSIYDEDAVTALELCARTASKTNECVKAINTHMEECEKEHKRFENDVQAQINDQNQVIQDAKEYMVDNLGENCSDLFDQAVDQGVFDTIHLETYQNMTKGVYNVLEFGAVGDGVTDDTQAIQTAIDTAGETGATVYIPAGKYLITAPLRITHHTRLIGAGKRGISETGITGTHIMVDNGDAGIIASADSVLYGAEIHDLRLTCVSVTAYGIDMDNVSECYLHNVTVNGGFDIGIHFKGTITNLDNLYICDNSIGLHLENCHAVTVSNLNSWQNATDAIRLTGSCCNVVVRDSWIENSECGIKFIGDESNPCICYNTTIQNTSFTAGSGYVGARFIEQPNWYSEIESTIPVRIRALRVSGCVVKIYDPTRTIGNHAVYLAYASDTLSAVFEGNTFFTNTSYNSAILHGFDYSHIALRDNVCVNYDGTSYNIIDHDGSHYCSLNSHSQYTELKSDRPIRFVPVTTSLASMDAGQLYYKNGCFRYTDGIESKIIPHKSVNVVGQLLSATTVDELLTHLNKLIVALQDAQIID